MHFFQLNLAFFRMRRSVLWLVWRSSLDSTQRHSFFNVQPRPGKSWLRGVLARTILTISSCSQWLKGGAFLHCVDTGGSLALAYYIDAPTPSPSDSCVRSVLPIRSHGIVACLSCTELEIAHGCKRVALSATVGKFLLGSVPISQSLVVSW